jgi:hypothetical protein
VLAFVEELDTRLDQYFDAALDQLLELYVVQPVEEAESAEIVDAHDQTVAR